jgi:hypothetical protein
MLGGRNHSCPTNPQRTRDDSRADLYYASMMTVLGGAILTLLALVVTYAPQGGVALAGFTLFSDTGLIATALRSDAGHRSVGIRTERGIRPSRWFQACRLPPACCCLR